MDDSFDDPAELRQASLQSAASRQWARQVEEQEPPSPARLPQPDADGNYQVPALERLRELQSLWEQGLVGADEALETLEQIDSFLEARIQEMEQSAQAGQIDGGDPTRQKILQGFVTFQEAVRMASAAFETAEEAPEGEDPLVAGVELAQEAANLIVEGYIEARRHQERAEIQLCPSCSAENRKGRERCRSCNRPLPVPAGVPLSSFEAVDQESRDDDAAPTTENFVKVSRAVESWKAGGLDDGQLLEVLEQVEAQHRGQLDNLQVREEGLEDSQREALRELIRLTEDALMANLSALETMKGGFGGKDPSLVDRGLQELALATESILEAYRRTEEAFGRSPAAT